MSLHISKLLMILLFVSLFPATALAFLHPSSRPSSASPSFRIHQHDIRSAAKVVNGADGHHHHHHESSRLSMALGDFTVELDKPLGMIIEECEAGRQVGVRVKELARDGSAASSSKIAPGDVLLQVQDVDVSSATFDSVMDLLIATPSPVRLTLGDGLGTMDMPPNVLKRLSSPEEALAVDAVVRAAVREVRKSGRLGELRRVEVVIGAGVQEEGNRVLVRFFAIFSTDGVSTYSCNVSATGVRRDDDDDGSFEIVALSCAKDEGLGQTVDLLVETSNTNKR